MEKRNFARCGWAGLAYGLTVLLQGSVAWAGSAVTVPMAARDTAAAAKADAQAVLDRQQAEEYRQRAEKDARQAAEEAQQAGRQVESAQQALVEQETAVQQAEGQQEASEKELSIALQAAQTAAAAADRSQAAVDDAGGQATAMEEQARAQDIARDQAITAHTAARAQLQPVAADSQPQVPEEEPTGDELLDKENEYRRLEAAYEAERQARQAAVPVADDWEPPSAADWSAVENAYTYANELAAQATILRQQSDAAWQAAGQAKKNDAAARKTLLAARQQRKSQQDYLQRAKDYQQRAADYAKRAQTALTQLIYAQAHPQPVYSFSLGSHFYQWKDSDGNHGHQLVCPLAAGYWQKDLSWYLTTNFVDSHVQRSAAEGSIGTLTDTVLYVTKRNEKKKFIVDYHGEINFPTGRAPLSFSERNARMNDDLWEKSMFGEGWKFAPGVDVSWRIGREDLWTIGTSYSFHGSYDPTSDVPGDTVSPGNGWTHHVRWEHAGQKWQFVGELFYSGTGRSSLSNGTGYATNSQLEYRLTYNRSLSKTTDWMLYYWHENRNVNTYVVDTAQAGVHYLGSMLSHRIGKSHRIRYTFDFMKSNGRCAANVYNYYDLNGAPQYQSVDVDGRTKYTVGLGYDINLTAHSTVSMDLEAFRMHDGAATDHRAAMDYTGWNFLLKYTHFF